MLDIAIVVGVGVVALLVGLYMQRRAPDPPTTADHSVPSQVDRDDFARPDAPWLVAVFTSDTCETCAKVWQATEAVESGEVAIQNVESTRDAALHERYSITAVPAVVIADSAGITRGSFLGPPSTADLWAALADVRDAAGKPD